MSSKDGRTEKPTPQRRRKAREEGQVPRSQEVAVAGSFLALVATLAIGGGPMVERAMADVRTIIATAGSDGALEAAGSRAFMLAAVLGAPFMAAAVVTGVAAGVAQVGVKFKPKLAKPDLKKLSPKRGLERFKPSTMSWELTRSVLKLGAVGIVVWPTLSAWRDHLATDRTVAGAIDRLTGAYGGIIVRATMLALLIAIADYAWQRRKHEKKLMMTRQDVKRDHKDTEGDPYLKATRRRRQSDLSRNRMLRDVTTADVVVANPVHIAVALRYDPEDAAPKVVAKGVDTLAERLKTAARRHGVPITTDPPLARTLYRRCRVGQHIPAALYEAVAVVLATAYRRSGRGPGSRRTQVGVA